MTGVVASSLPTGDVFALTAALVDIASESFNEQEIVAVIEAELRACPHLTVDRIGDNLIARTMLGRDRRLVLGGHTDTVPANGNAGARIEGDRMYGVGTSDMKGGLATMLELARTVTEPAIDLTYVFYAREEVAVIHNGLREIEAERPDLLDGDVAYLASRPSERSKLVVREPCGSRSPFRGPGPTLLAHGWDAMRFIAWANCLRSSRPTRPAVLSSKGASTARHCRRCMSKVALPAMSCPTRPWCGSTIVSHPIDPARKPWPTCVLCWHRRWRMATRSRSPISRRCPPRAR